MIKILKTHKPMACEKGFTLHECNVLKIGYVSIDLAFVHSTAVQYVAVAVVFFLIGLMMVSAI